VALNLPTDETFLTTEEVIEYLSVNLRTVYRLIKAGSIPAVRVGRQWRFRKRDLDEWLEGQRPGEGGIRISTPVPAPARRRVLLVDDEESMRNLLSALLEPAYDVEIAADGETAMRLLSKPDTHYDLLISDLNMPDMDGLALIREAHRVDSSLPAIIITGYSSESSAIEALNIGVTGYLTKPFGAAQVLAAVAKALGARPA
jgi:excisionase family DNA binding protein